MKVSIQLWGGPEDGRMVSVNAESVPSEVRVPADPVMYDPGTVLLYRKVKEAEGKKYWYFGWVGVVEAD